MSKPNAVKPAAAKKGVAPAKTAAIKETVCGKLAYPGGFPVYLSRYLITGGPKPRAALRFYNGCEAVVTGVRFRLTEKDGEGKPIAEYSLERRGLFAERGCEFSVADVAVDPRCALLEAKLETVFSEPYEYDVDEDGATTVRYGVTEREPEYFFMRKPVYSVKKRRKKYIIISLIAVLAVTAAAGLTAWRLGIFGKAFPERAESAVTDTTYEFGERA